MGKVISLKDKLRKKKYGDPGESLKGRGFPADYTFGPDDLNEPYEVVHEPCEVPEEVKKECPDWILKILRGED